MCAGSKGSNTLEIRDLLQMVTHNKVAANNNLEKVFGTIIFPGMRENRFSHAKGSVICLYHVDMYCLMYGKLGEINSLNPATENVFQEIYVQYFHIYLIRHMGETEEFCSADCSDCERKSGFCHTEFSILLRTYLMHLHPSILINYWIHDSLLKSKASMSTKFV